MKLFLRYLPIMLVVLSVSTQLMGQSAEEVTESSEPLENFYIDDIVQRTDELEVAKAMAYEPIREADIAWEKRIWRIIDTREKMNLPFRYPEKPFFSIIREHLENGDMKAFQDEAFKEEMLPEDVLAKLNRIDTISVFNEETYEEQIKIVQSEISADDIVRFRIKEIWYFDEEASAMKVRILGIAPIKDVFDEDTGVFKYEIPLFWVYYPEARDYFAKHRVFNDFNDASPMTWSDLFDVRFFASYIYKQSNSLDLRLKDIYTEADQGIEMLLESERIKEELFNFEHDLWEY